GDLGFPPRSDLVAQVVLPASEPPVVVPRGVRPVVGDLAGQQFLVAPTHARILAVSDTAAMGNLAADTAVSGADGRYQATLSPDWEIWGPNGGYVASIALRAAGAHSAFDRPATFSCHYLAVARFDAVDLDVRTLRRTKRAES